MINVAIYRGRDGELVARVTKTIVGEPYVPSEEVGLFELRAVFAYNFLDELTNLLAPQLPPPIKPE